MLSCLVGYLFATTLSPHAQSGAVDHVRFVVTGDDRWNTKAPRPGLDENGVNVTGLGRIVTAILSEKPDALLFNGDLVGGGETDEEETSQFDTWLKKMKPIYDAGIRVLAARGNHEMHCPHAADVWKKALSGPYANPMNGPVGEEGMTYAFPLKNVLFLSLDQFQTKDLGINQAWLDQTLKAPHPPHVFAFAHKMAFFSGNHTDGMNTTPEPRDRFIESLASAGARAVFFGHDHLYDHVAAKLSGWTDTQAIHQFVVGTAGAPFVTGKELPKADGNWSLARVAHVEGALGYCLVDVNGPKVTIVYKSEKAPGDFEAVDTYTYTIGK
jgi:Calcineurin-like phosphoesterase